MAAAPTFVAMSTPITGTTVAGTLAWPTHQQDDWGFLIVESDGLAPVLAPPAGWTAISASTDVASAAGSTVYVLYRRAQSNAEASVTIPVSGDHFLATIAVFRGVQRTDSPFSQASVSGTKTTASTTVTFPAGLTSSVDNSLVLYIASRPDDSASTTNFGVATNAGLTSLAEAGEAGTISGNGGGFVVGYGTKAVAGAIGATTMTSTVSSTNTVFQAILPPYVPNPPVTRNPVQYTSDNKTPMTTGAANASGATNGIILGFDVRHGNDSGGNNPVETFSVRPYFEVEPTSTTFDNSPSTIPQFPLFTNPDEPTGLRTSNFGWDSVRHRFIMFGGANGSTNFNQVWELRVDGGRGKWRKLNPTGTAPIGRYQAGGVFDATNNRWITIFGFTTVDTNEVWELSFLTNPDGVWTNRTSGITGTAPVVRSNVHQAIANDPANNCAYVFGGWGAAYMNDVWKLNYSTTAMAWTNPGANAAAGAPGIRRSANLLLDKVNNRLIVWGGAVSGTTFDTALYAFSLTGNTWSTLTPTGGPPAGRELAAGAVDPVGNDAYIWGGWQGASANMQQSLWKLDMSTTNCTWTNLSNANATWMPLGTYGTAMAYDPDNLQLVLWSGVDNSAVNDLQHHVLVIDPAETTPVLYGMVMNHYARPADAVSNMYDTVNNVAVIAGGYSQINDNINYDTSVVGNSAGHIQDVFTFDSSISRFRMSINGTKTFPHREGASLVNDTVNNRYLLFGGLWGAGGGTPGTFNDVWEIKRNSFGDLDIRQMTPTGTLPGRRWLHCAAFDATNNRMIITCGSDGGAANYNDVWALNFSGGGDGAWASLTPTGTAPTAKWGAGYAYSTTGHKLYIYGGATSVGDGTFGNQFHSLDLTATTPVWTLLTSGPSARRSMGLAWDSTNNQLALFGGYTGSVQSDLYYYNIATPAWSASVTPTGTGPLARRSHAMWWDPVLAKFIISHGRVATGNWFGDTFSLTPNYTTPASSAYARITTATNEQVRQKVTTIATDAYAPANVSTTAALGGLTTDNTAVSQSFVADVTGTLSRAGFVLARPSATAGTIQAEIWSTTGTHGTNAVPSSLLATSVARNVSSISSTAQSTTLPLMEYFTFTSGNKITMTAGTTYAVVIRQASSVVTAGITVGVDNTSPTHNGNYASALGSAPTAWTASTTQDIIFSVEIDLPNNANYHWQYWADEGTDASLVATLASYGGNAESATDFTLGTAIAQFTRTQTTDTLKRRQLIAAHTSDAVRRKTFSIAHTTSARLWFGRGHTTDAYKLPASVFSTITYDNSANSAVVTSSFTVGNNPNRILFVTVHEATGPTSVTGVTYAGSAMTLLNTQTMSGGGSGQILIYYIKQPATGANNVVVTGGGGNGTKVTILSLYNVDQTSPFDGSIGLNDVAGFNNTTSNSTSVTTTAANDWLLSWITVAGSSGTTEFAITVGGIRQTVAPGTSAGGQADRAVTTAGTYTMVWTRNQTTSRESIVSTIAVKPAVTLTTRTTTRDHTTDAYKTISTPSFTRTQTTDALKRKQTTVSHTTDALKRKTNTKFHTTDVNKRVSGLTKVHTTDANKRVSGLTRVHSTDANKRVTGITRSHTTDALKRVSGLTRSHTTDALKRSQNTRSHTTDAFKRTQNIRSHTTDALKRKQSTKFHTTDANKRVSGLTKFHTTDANKRISGFTRAHSTDTVKTVRFTKVHTTDALKRTQNTRSHTTDAFKRAQLTRAHTTDSLLRRQTTRSHSTDANKRKTLTVFHTTSANKRTAGLTRSHSTDTLKRTQNTRFHTTDAVIRRQLTRTHTTDALKRKANTLSHTTDANKRLATVKFHTTDTNKRTSGLTRSHTTDSLLRRQIVKTHTTDALKRKQFTLSHTTDSFKRTQNTRTHSTDANKRKATTVSHSTDTNKRVSGLTRSHTTDANRKKTFTVSHSTSANKRTTGLTKSHTTDTLLRRQLTRTHTTDALKRKQSVVSHTTDAALRKANTRSHTTDANKRATLTRFHTTDANKRVSGLTRSHSTDANKRVSGLARTHTTDALKRKQLVLSHSTDTLKRIQTVKTHTTDALKRRAVTVSHTTGANTRKAFTVSQTTNANKRKALSVFHTTDANKRTAGLTKLHTTDSFLRKQLTRTHTTDALKRKQTILSHTTDTLKRTQNTVAHTTGANKSGSQKRRHLTDANLRLSGLVVSHSTDTNKRKSGITLSHSTDTQLRTAFYRAHSTDSLLRTQKTRSHSTDSLKRKQNVVSHTTDSLIRRQNIKTHTTDANKRKVLSVSHTTDGNKRKTFTVSHTTSANKRVANITRSHSTDSLKRSQNVRTHTTDTLKRTQNTRSHSTDALKRRQLVRTHSTDTNKRRAYTITHSTDANKRTAGLLRSHSTDANKRTTGLTRSHTTDALKRVSGLLRTHTTDSFLRRQIVKTHTTDSLKRKQNILSQSTDALVRKVNTRSHTTDANKRRTSTVSHTTDANKRLSGLTRSHTTDTNKRLSGLIRSHTTDTLKRKQNTTSHTTDSNKRRANTVSHTTDFLKRTQLTRSHTTDANKRLSGIVRTHSTDTLKRKQNVVSHSTSANKRKASVVSHTTDANKRTSGLTRTHTTDAFLRKQFVRSHSTDSNKRRSTIVSHTTDSNKRVSGFAKFHTTDGNKRKTGFTVFHNASGSLLKATLQVHATDANKRKATVVSHTTDTLKRQQFAKSHSTDTLKRKANTLSHSTDSNKRKATLVSHSTDANKRKSGLVRTHTTDSLLRKQFVKTHSTDANKRTTGLVKTHTTDALKRAQNVKSHSTDALKRSQTTKIHLTDALKRKQFTKTHSTDTNKRVANIARSHTTDALKRTQNLRSHTTDTLKRTQNVKLHTTDALKRTLNVRSHTTDANKRKSGLLRSHTTDALLRRQLVKTHSTDALKRAQTVRTHSTDANKRKTSTRFHTTDGIKLAGRAVLHTTDANKRKTTAVFHKTDANKRFAGFTKVHTADALKHTSTLVSHSTDTILHDTHYYTRESNPVLPTDSGPRSIGFSQADYGTVSADDSTYVAQPGYKYLLFYFERYSPSNRYEIHISWNGKSSIWTQTRPVYLQIYNNVSGLWETLDMNNSTLENIDFTLSGNILTGMAPYYDANTKIVVRVYQ